MVHFDSLNASDLLTGDSCDNRVESSCVVVANVYVRRIRFVSNASLNLHIA